VQEMQVFFTFPSYINGKKRYVFLARKTFHSHFRAKRKRFRKSLKFFLRKTLAVSFFFPTFAFGMRHCVHETLLKQLAQTYLLT
jgi:hypothetical protein